MNSVQALTFDVAARCEFRHTPIANHVFQLHLRGRTSIGGVPLGGGALGRSRSFGIGAVGRSMHPSVAGLGQISIPGSTKNRDLPQAEVKDATAFEQTLRRNGLTAHIYSRWKTEVGSEQNRRIPKICYFF